VNGPEHRQTIQFLDLVAWNLATSDAPELRNGTNAVRLAEEAVAATHRKNASCLDTLAAAYAETQQFDKAVALEQEALAQPQSEKNRKECGEHLKLYQAHQPYREPAYH
jgi:hypothetical protein